MARYTAVFEKIDGWWVAHVEGLAGANTQGRTLRSARRNLQEAVRLVLEIRRDIARDALGRGRRRRSATDAAGKS